jgi:hypothetical protein
VTVPYSLYGLQLASNVPIPGLMAGHGMAPTDVEVCLGPFPTWLGDLLRESPREIHYLSSMKDETGRPSYHLWRVAGGDYFHLRYLDETTFVLDRQGARVWAAWPEPLTLEDTATYLLGPVFGFLLGLRGYCCLHASVVVVDGWAVALLGSAGAGKSTTAAAFARQGDPVLSDDVAALLDRHGHLLVQPAYPHLRLWPSSVTTLYGSPDALPLLTPTWEKCRLDLTGKGYHFQEQPTPLAAVYALDDRRDEPSAPYVEAFTGRAAFLHLLGNTYASHLLLPPERTREFALLGRLARTVPLRRVIPHTDPRHLARLCDVIRADFRALAANGRLAVEPSDSSCIASPPMSV